MTSATPGPRYLLNSAVQLLWLHSHTLETRARASFFLTRRASFSSVALALLDSARAHAKVKLLPTTSDANNTDMTRSLTNYTRQSPFFHTLLLLLPFNDNQRARLKLLWTLGYRRHLALQFPKLPLAGDTCTWSKTCLSSFLKFCKNFSIVYIVIIYVLIVGICCLHLVSTKTNIWILLIWLFDFCHCWRFAFV